MSSRSIVASPSPAPQYFRPPSASRTTTSSNSTSAQLDPLSVLGKGWPCCAWFGKPPPASVAPPSELTPVPTMNGIVVRVNERVTAGFQESIVPGGGGGGGESVVVGAVVV